MIVEFPATACTRGAAPKRGSQMARGRTALIHACGVPNTSEFLDLRGTATVTGVGFFDFKHGHSGVAPNAIELHPVLGFRRGDAWSNRVSAGMSAKSAGSVDVLPSSLTVPHAFY